MPTIEKREEKTTKTGKGERKKRASLGSVSLRRSVVCDLREEGDARRCVNGDGLRAHKESCLCDDGLMGWATSRRFGRRNSGEALKLGQCPQQMRTSRRTPPDPVHGSAGKIARRVLTSGTRTRGID